MAKFRSRSTEATGAKRVRTADLIKHYQAYGLSEGTGYRGKKSRYKSYKMLAKDPLIEVAFDWLGADSYVQVIEAVGYGEFAEEARKDWEDEHAD